MAQNTWYTTFNHFTKHFTMSIHEHGLYHGDESWHYTGVNSPYHRLYFTISGNPMIRMHGQVIPLEPHSIYLVPAHTLFDYFCHEPFYKFYIHFNAYLYGCFDIFSQCHECLRIPFSQQELDEYLHYIRSNMIQDQIMGEMLSLRILHRFTERYNMDLDAFFREQTRLKEIYDYIRTRCSIVLDQEQIADMFDIQIASLNKQFKKLNGITIKQYNDDYILTQSQIRLASSQEKVNEIAEMLGFSDPYYFSKFFKKRTGVSPREYRNRQITLK